LNEILKTLRYW